MKSISCYISEILVDSGAISKDEADICKYGIDYFIISILEILSILIVSAFTGNFINSLVYFTSFIPLRIYAGGYHADTKLRCYIILWLVYAIYLLLLNTVPLNLYNYVAIISALVSTGFVLGFAPVVTDSKKISDTERKYYRRISTAILFVEISIILVACTLAPEHKLLLSFSLGQLSAGLSMLVAVVKEKFKRE